MCVCVCVCVCVCAHMCVFCSFLAELGFRCCTWAFSRCGEQGLLFVAVCGLLIAVVSVVVEHGL